MWHLTTNINRRDLLLFVTFVKLGIYAAGFVAGIHPSQGMGRLPIVRAGIACRRADTLKVKGFIRSFGTHGKSDTIDADMLWSYGRERWAKQDLWQTPDADETSLRALVRRRQELIAMKVAEKNRAKAPGGDRLGRFFKAVINVIERQIQIIDADIRELIANGSTLKHRAAVCTAMDSLGPAVAAKLLAILPELGTMTRRKGAALAGLAPHPNDSGQKHGYRKIRADDQRSGACSTCPRCTPLPDGASSQPSANASSPTARSQWWPSPPSCARSSSL
ncbi:transposase [Mesorhizobium abyssinicae]|uniref:IS110 family transposase n=1 Tax=Mesorhizobium abyssinicae TaxID=1209958 RepID=UPI002A24B947|nr:transposase [Mesorhizobium abyssinicae]MDX8437282.1 transposase [Mesorhizobium abyssinicae]